MHFLESVLPRTLILFVLILLTMNAASAQELSVSVSDTLTGWSQELVTSLNGSQASYKNWSQGGVNTVSGTGALLFKLKHRNDRMGYGLITNLKYGQTRLGGDEVRKTDDLLALKTRISYTFDDPRVNGFGSVSFNTQFDKGYDYSGDDPVLISKFMAPGYSKQLAGLSFDPADFISAEAGLGFKETFMADTALSTLYGLDAGESFRFEPGLNIAVNVEKEIFKNVLYSGGIQTFTNLQTSLDATDVTFSNELIGRINNNLNTTIQFVVLYDKDYSTALQIKQVLSVGFSYQLM